MAASYDGKIFTLALESKENSQIFYRFLQNQGFGVLYDILSNTESPKDFLKVFEQMTLMKLNLEEHVQNAGILGFVVKEFYLDSSDTDLLLSILANLNQNI